MQIGPEDVIVVRKLWEEGGSSGQIVNYFGGVYTRNQVLGKLFRMGLLGYRKDPYKHRPPQFLESRIMEIKRKRRQNQNAGRRKTRSDGKPIAPPIPLPAPTNVATRSFNCVSGPSYDLMDLNRTDCRWPLGDPQEVGFSWCAAPALRDGPYCWHHANLAYTPPVRR